MELNKIQLKYALLSNERTSKQNCFVVSLDQLNSIDISTNFLCIFNHKPSNIVSGHWSLIYYVDGKVTYFDPLCLPLSREILMFLAKLSKKVTISKLQTQSFKMSSCGYFVLFVANKLCLNVQLENVLSILYGLSFKEAEQIVLSYVNRNFKILM